MFKKYIKSHIGGFTLLEMLVVIAILAALGGAMLLSADNLREGALRQVAQTEMQKVKQALLQYRQDIGDFPAPSHPADFAALYEQGSLPIWDASTGRGWRGPYLSQAGEGLVDVGDDVVANGAGSPVLGNTVTELRGVADPFVAAPTQLGNYRACEEDEDNSPNTCLLDWRTATGLSTHSRWGRPYLLFDLGDRNKARLVSMGPDGIYGGVNATDACAPNADDLVLCLLR